jgi:hypothetical protein
MRAGLAISLLLFALAYQGSTWGRVLLAVLSTLSHISVLPATALLLVFSKIPNSRLKILIWGSIVAALTLAGTNFLADLTRAEGLANNPGNITALLLPSLTVAMFSVQLRITRASDLRIHAIAGLFIALSLGSVLPAVTISIRLLEIGWCLMHYSLFIDLLDPQNRAQQRPLRYTLAAFLSMLMLANVLRSTWITAITL